MHIIYLNDHNYITQWTDQLEIQYYARKQTAGRKVQLKDMSTPWLMTNMDWLIVYIPFNSFIRLFEKNHRLGCHTATHYSVCIWPSNTFRIICE